MCLASRDQSGLANISSIDFFFTLAAPAGAAPVTRLGIGVAVLPRVASLTAVSPPFFGEVGVAGTSPLEVGAGVGDALALGGIAGAIGLTVGAGGDSPPSGADATSGCAAVGTAADTGGASSVPVVDRGHTTTIIMRSAKTASTPSMPRRAICFFEKASRSLAGDIAPDIDCAVWLGSAVGVDGLMGRGAVTCSIALADVGTEAAGAALGAATMKLLFGDSNGGGIADWLPISMDGADGCVFLSAAALIVPAIRSAEIRAAGVP